MQFIAMASSGAYLASAPPVSKTFLHVTQHNSVGFKLSTWTPDSAFVGVRKASENMNYFKDKCYYEFSGLYNCFCVASRFRFALNSMGSQEVVRLKHTPDSVYY